LRTRTLTRLSAALIAAGAGAVALGRHTALPAITAGTLLAAAIPCAGIAARRHVAAERAAAYNDGYRCGIRHATRGDLNQ
jgi:hypothetical protein